MLSNIRLLTLFKNSLFLAGGSALIAVALGLPAAFFLARVRFRFKRLIRGLFLIPILIPPYIHTLSWRFLFSNLKIASYPTFLFTLPAAVLILSIAYLPIPLFLIENALKKIDADSENAALLFSSRLKTTFKITLPLIAPAIFSSFLFVFLLGLIEFGVPSFLHVNTFVFEIFAQFSAFFNYTRAFMLTAPLLLITLTVIGLWFLTARKRTFVTLSTSSKPIQTIQTTLLAKLIVGLILLILIGFSVVLPLTSLLWQAREWRSFEFAFVSSKSIMLTTLWLSALSASLLIIFAIVFLILPFYKIHSSKPQRFKRGELMRFFWLATLAVPSVSLGIILIKIFNRPFLEVIYTSFWIIVIGFGVRFFPFALETLNVFFKQIDPKLIEAAQLAGASGFQIFKNILFPLLLPGILVAWLVTFILSLGELSTTLLVYPSGYQTLPIRIFTLLHYGAPELVAALSIILVGIILIFTGLGLIVVKQYDPNR